MGWDSDLIPASLGGIEFPLRGRQIFGGNDFARAKYQNVPGQDIEPTGLDARRFEIRAELFEDIDPMLYPGRYRDLHKLLQDKGNRGEVEYVDVVWGPINVIIDHWEIIEEAEKRNGASFVFYLEERSAEPVQAKSLRFLDPRGLSLSLANAIDSGILLAAIPLPAIEQSFADIGWPLTPEESASFPGTLFKLTDDMFSLFDEAALSLDDIAFEVDRYRYRVDRILSFDAVKSAEGWSIFAAATQLKSTVVKVATAVGLSDAGSDQGPQQFQYEVPSEMSASDISRLIYGDASKAGRIEQLNPTPNPLFYQAGQVITLDAVAF